MWVGVLCVWQECQSWLQGYWASVATMPLWSKGFQNELPRPCDQVWFS